MISFLDETIKKELRGDKILLVSLKSEDYREFLKNLIKFLIKFFKKTCYVTVNDPYESILSGLIGGKGSKIFFIDCVTKTVKSAEPKEDVMFVSSPHALTEISIALKEELKKGVDFMIFDSVSTMLIYEKPLTVLKFIHNLILKLRTLKLGVVFIILKEDASKEVLKDLTMMVDKILEV